MDFKKIIILFVICFLFSFNYKNYEEERNVYSLGQIKLTFINVGECGCDESCSFSLNSTSSFNFSIPTNFNRENRIKVETQFEYDSLFIYQRENYEYALVVSETEGIIRYSHDSLYLSKKLSNRTPWHFRVLTKESEFSILDTFESRSNTKYLPNINIKRAQAYLASIWLGYEGKEPTETEIEKFKTEHEFGIFVSSIEIRLKYYIKGEIKRITLVFDYRHGEC